VQQLAVATRPCSYTITLFRIGIGISMINEAIATVFLI
jgi:hypothetical protein